MHPIFAFAATLIGATANVIGVARGTPRGRTIFAPLAAICLLYAGGYAYLVVGGNRDTWDEFYGLSTPLVWLMTAVPPLLSVHWRRVDQQAHDLAIAAAVNAGLNREAVER